MIIVDDFIKDESLLKELQDDKTFFNENGKYKWWGGPWSSEASNLKERLIQEIWIHNSPWDFPRYNSISLEGFEYWTGRYSPDTQHPSTLDLHLDKDEALWQSTLNTGVPILSIPIMGSVYYPIEMDIDGGYLEIFSNGEDKEPERVAAKHNRLIIFPAGEHPHRVTEVTRGTRSAIAINLWNTIPDGLNPDLIK